MLPSPDARPLTCAGQGDMANNLGPWAPTEPSPDSRAQTRTHTHQPIRNRESTRTRSQREGPVDFSFVFTMVFRYGNWGRFTTEQATLGPTGGTTSVLEWQRAALGRCHMSPRRHTHAEQLWSKGYSRGNGPGARTPSIQEAKSCQLFQCVHNAFEFAFLPVFSEPMELCGAPPLPQETPGI